MSVEEILRPVIEQEFEKYERSGQKVKLRSIMKDRIKYTLLCSLGAIFCFPVFLIVYIVLMLQTSKVKTIVRLAKIFPDMSVSDIISSEMQPYQSKEIVGMAVSCLGIIGCLACGFGIATVIVSGVANGRIVTHSESKGTAESQAAISRQKEHTYIACEDGYMLISGGSNYMTAESIVIPNQYQGQDVVAIGEYAFAGYDSLQSVEIPGTVKKIEKNAFNKCANLTALIIPEGVEVIEGGAFMECSSLKEVSFGSTVSEIGGECFKRCISLKRIEIPMAVTEIRGNCFEDCIALSKVTLHDNVEEIHAYAFANCGALEEIVLPSKITEIKGNTFENCVSLKRIEIPKGVVRIGGHAFHNCESLSEVYVPPTVREIGSSAFRECDNLDKILLPKNANVNQRAFKDSPTTIYFK